MAEWITRPVAFASRHRDRYGEAFTVNIEPRPWVMVGDPADVRTVFTAGPERTNAGEANEILRPTLGSHSLLLLDGEEHLRQRKLMLPAFHGERIDRYREIMRAVFGVEDAAAMARVGEPLRRLLDWAGEPGALLILATLGPNNRIVRRLLAERYVGPVDRELYALIAERRAAPDLAERDDVLSTLLLARDEDGEPMTDVELRDELLTLLVAGHETTATSLAWAVERLLRHPGGLQRLAGDAEYTVAVVKEILRLRPVVAVVLR